MSVITGIYLITRQKATGEDSLTDKQTDKQTTNRHKGRLGRAYRPKKFRNDSENVR